MQSTLPSSDLFRRVMGSFPTGITVITAKSAPGQVHGMTANSFTSVSLDPLLILICVDQKAHLLRYVKAERRFGVNILKDSHRPLAEHFACPQQDPSERARLNIRFRWTETGVPLLDDSLAHLTCYVVAQYMAGDHTIFVGEVQLLALFDGNPLLHLRGQYRSL